jgi:putative ABC transport system permease protein
MEIGPILRAIRRNKARFGLIAAEVALTLAVVVNCVALIVDSRRKMAHPSGFDDENLLTVQSNPFGDAFKEETYRKNVLDADLAALRATPGVRAAMNTRFIPWQGGGSSGELKPVGSPGPRMRTQQYSVDEGLIDTLDLKLVEGRQFTREDVDRYTRQLVELFAIERPRGRDGHPKDKFLQEIVISRAFAEKVFGPAPSYLGKMLEDSDTDQYRVIGVIDEFFNPYPWPIDEDVIFFANLGSSYEGGSRYLVRTEPGQAAGMMRTIEDALTRVNGQRTVRVQRVTDIRQNFFGPQRVTAWLMGLVVALLILVTGLGIVGITSFLVTERTRQIGTRRALGARMVDILRYFLLENWIVTTFGILVGIGLAIGLNVALLTVIEGAKVGPGTIIAGAVLLWLIGLGSALVPALRAARTSPAVATRSV